MFCVLYKLQLNSYDFRQRYNFNTLNMWLIAGFQLEFKGFNKSVAFIV